LYGITLRRWSIILRPADRQKYSSAGQYCRELRGGFPGHITPFNHSD
jgi:hypothetical protein